MCDEPNAIFLYSSLPMFWNNASFSPLCTSMFPVATLPEVYRYSGSGWLDFDHYINFQHREYQGPRDN